MLSNSFSLPCGETLSMSCKRSLLLPGSESLLLKDSIIVTKRKKETEDGDVPAESEEQGM